VFVGPGVCTTNDDTMARHDASYELRGAPQGVPRPRWCGPLAGRRGRRRGVRRGRALSSRAMSRRARSSSAYRHARSVWSAKRRCSTTGGSASAGAALDDDQVAGRRSSFTSCRRTGEGTVATARRPDSVGILIRPGADFASLGRLQVHAVCALRTASGVRIMSQTSYANPCRPTYSTSRSSISLNPSWLRPDTCHRPVIPGRTLKRSKCSRR
jgi:hypothetical protein